MSVQSILLRRFNKIALPVEEYGSAPKNYVSLAQVATFNLNLQSLGYTLSAEALLRVVALSAPHAETIFSEVLSSLKELKGVQNYKPMYPGFPTQVIEASDAELYINAVVHYFSSWVVDLSGNPDNIWLPKYAKNKREPLDEKIELKVIRHTTHADADELVSHLATSNTSLSATDKEDLCFLLGRGFGYPDTFLPQVKNKENLAFMGSLLINRGYVDITPYFKTATDVLRLAVALSGGDVSLSETTKFKSLKRPLRRYLLSLLESIPNKAEDMLRWKTRWIRLGEYLHPGEFKNRFPTTFAAFQALRNNEHIETFNSKAEFVVRSGNGFQAAIVLSERPGDFARRLDHVLRQASVNGAARIVSTFLAVADKVSTPVLLQVLTHFKHRNDGSVGIRVAMPKGNVAKVTEIHRLFGRISKDNTDLLVEGISDILIKRFRALPSLGKVYLDPQLQDYLLPFSQRSASKSLRTLVRGSKVSFGEGKNTLRFFIWWKDMDTTGSVDVDAYDYLCGGNRVDLDLSACAYDADWKNIGAVTYYNLRETFAWHSGDITSAPKGASEFIDVDIEKALESGVRYIIPTIHSYTSQNFADVPECSAGFMLREKPKSGEVYDPRTVVDRLDITMEAQSGVPFIIDIVDRKVIWVDAAMKNHDRYSYGGNNVENTRGSIELLGKAFTGIKKPNLYDLLALHTFGRGEFVNDPSEADVVYSVEAGTPFELERIASEFMTNAT